MQKTDFVPAHELRPGHIFMDNKIPMQIFKTTTNRLGDPTIFFAPFGSPRGTKLRAETYPPNISFEVYYRTA